MELQDQWNSMNAHTRIPNDNYTCRLESKLTNQLDQRNWNTYQRGALVDEVVAVTNHKRWMIMNVCQSADCKRHGSGNRFPSGMTRKLEGDQSGCSRGRRAPPHVREHVCAGAPRARTGKIPLGTSARCPG